MYVGRRQNVLKPKQNVNMSSGTNCHILKETEVVGGQRSRDVEEHLKRSRAELLWVQRQLSLISKRSAARSQTKDKLRSHLLSRQLAVQPPQSVERYRLLEVKNRALRLEVAALRHARQQRRLLENELQQALQETSFLTQELINQTQRASQYEQVKSNYEQLREICTSVIQERDSALKERSQLQGRLEQLEQVLQAQKEAEKEHEDTMHLLGGRVQELEQSCSLLHQQLEGFCLWSRTTDILRDEPLRTVDKVLAHILNGLTFQVEKDNTSSSDSRLKSELLSVTQMPPPAQDGSASPRQDSQSEMDGDVNMVPRPEAQFTKKVRLCMARYSYNPFDGPNEHPEAELPLVAGKYLYIYGTMDDDGFYQGELPDGQKGLVPSNYVDFVQDKSRALIPSSDDNQEADPSEEEGRWSPHEDLPVGCNNENGSPDADEVKKGLVPFPRRITLIKQLVRSVIIGWEPPATELPVDAYDVLVDQEVRCRVTPSSWPKLLLEKLDLSARSYRISVRSMTECGHSDELRCSLLVGRGVTPAPRGLQIDNITRDSANISWLPSDSNYSHTVLLNGREHRLVGPAWYRCSLCGLSPMTSYRVTVVTRPHREPWWLPLEQREKREASLEFCTQPAGPPFPPQEVQVLCGQMPWLLRVTWKPPILTPLGMSNGASVTGYAVCTKGQRIAEVMAPAAEYITVDLNQIQNLQARELVVRTLSVQGESQDSEAVTIPQGLLAPPTAHSPAVCPRLVNLPRPTEPHLQPQPPPPQPWLQPHPLHDIPQPQFEPLANGWEENTKELEEDPAHHHTTPNQPWGLGYTLLSPLIPSQDPGPTSEAKPLQPCCSAFPPRISPHTQRASISNTVIRATTQEATLGAASDISQSSDEEGMDRREQDNVQQNGPSLDELLTDSELGRQRGRSEESQTESSRCTDLSDIVEEEEEEEEEVHADMPLADTCYCRGPSHSTLKILGTPPNMGQPDPRDAGSGRKPTYSGGASQQTANTIPSIEITPESNSEENLSLTKEENLSSSNLGQTRPWPPSCSGQHRHDGAFAQEHDGVARLKDSCRTFVAVFDYNPISMSPNPHGADEELSFKEGHILKVFGDKDKDGFYWGEKNGRTGLIPCNMVSEIQVEDRDTTDQHVHLDFLPLSTPEDKIELSKQGDRRPLMPRRKMVALYDYDPRENSPNVDVEAELTFSAGDIITVLGDIDEDGFYYGEINGHGGLVPSNFLEEVPGDAKVHLTDTQTVSQKSKESPPSTASPKLTEAPQDPVSKRKKGLLSKGKKLWKRLTMVQQAM